MRYNNLVQQRFLNLITQFSYGQPTFYHYFTYDFITNKMINYLMLDGRKERAISIFKATLFYIKKLTRLPPLYIFKRCIINCFLLFDFKLLTKRRVSKKRSSKRKRKPRILFSLLNPKVRLVRALKFVQNISKRIKAKKKLLFFERLALSVLMVFFRRGSIFSSVKLAYKYLAKSRSKLKELLKIRKTSKRFFIKMGRARKEVGFYNFNPYTLTPWLRMKS